MILMNMKRKDYENYKWYPVTDKTYWVDDYCDEFPNCKTIVRDTTGVKYDMAVQILTENNCYLGWGTMAKSPEYFSFMIVEV